MQNEEGHTQILISFFPKFKYLFLMGDFVVVIIIIILGVLNEFASNENEREEEKCPNGERKKNDCIFHGTYCQRKFMVVIHH